MTSFPAPNTISGRSAFIELLKSEGVTHLFGNPGTTELPIMHALADHPDMRYVLGLQESIVVAMADGYARASGRLAACNVHVAPGLGNAMGTLFTAFNSGTPLIVTAGQQEQGHGLTEPLLYAPLVPMAAPVVKWATEVTRLDDLPRIVHRAAKVATTPPTGPVFISLPGDILNAFGAIDLGQATRVDTRVRPSDEALHALAVRLLNAKRPVIIAGHEIVAGDAFAEAVRFAEVMGCPVYDQTVLQGAHFPTEHPAYLGPLSRDQKTVRARLDPYDTVISIGSDFLRMSVYSEVEPLPPHMSVIQIGLRDGEMGKTYPAEIALRADVKETLRVLAPLIAELGGTAQHKRAQEGLAALAGRNWTATRRARAEAALAKAAQPIDPEWLMLTITDLLPTDAIVVDEALTTAASLASFMRLADRYAYFGNVSGGIGWGVAAAVGVQLAQPSRKVVALIGDGSAMYSIQALWTAAHQKLPIIFVVFNNGGYRIIKQRLKLFHNTEHFIGMDFVDPPIEFAKLANALGVQSRRVETPAVFRTAFAEALGASEPVLLEVIVEGSV
ncbi:MAG TPA: thiamine pyrophosphate-dependent enzyme [Stellaceae bacterium]|jgi:benzoylformate decarboxylase|nr:thiamine pyrophosphate-dependent enzyme [Stellaceae bacterium]